MLINIIRNNNRILHNNVSTTLNKFTQRSYLTVTQQQTYNHYYNKSRYTSSITSILTSLIAATGITYYYINAYNTPVECCGIVGFVSTNEPCLDHLLDGLHILQNRGYDSAGIATIHKNNTSSSPKSKNKHHKSLSINGSPSTSTRNRSNSLNNSTTTADILSPLNSPSSVRITEEDISNTDGEDSNSNNVLRITKFASHGSTSDSIDLLKRDAPLQHRGDLCGIAHTRWATHGAKTDENAHPHSDTKQRIALCHNGTIENSSSIKDELINKGISFTSQTDTEVIVQLIGLYIDEGHTFHDSVKRALGRLEGTWGLVIVHKDYPNEIVAAKHGSPLCIGISQNRMFVASEVSAFSRHTNQYIAMKEGEIAVVRADGVSLDMTRVEMAHVEQILMSPTPYTHWTIKEIFDQPEAISRALNYGARFTDDGMIKLGGMEDNKKMLLSIKHLIISACGTSLYAAQYGMLLLQSLKCFDSIQCIDASEVNVDSFPLHDAGLLVISQSGETKDTHRALIQATNLLIPTFSIVNQVGSLIARTTNCGVYLNAGREHAVASTKAFTTQVTALSLVAGWYSQNRDLIQQSKQRRSMLIESIHRLPIYVGMTLQCHNQIKRIAQQLKDVQHLFVLGKGYSEPIAKEGALKIKEITYIHAEGYSGGALKHGPFALLCDNIPVIHIILDDQHAELMKIAAAETKARGTNNIIITDNKSLINNDLCDSNNIIKIPQNSVLTALLAVIPLQLLAYEISIAKGYNPDKPRNLAKAVTVD